MIYFNLIKELQLKLSDTISGDYSQYLLSLMKNTDISTEKLGKI